MGDQKGRKNKEGDTSLSLLNTLGTRDGNRKKEKKIMRKESKKQLNKKQ